MDYLEGEDHTIEKPAHYDEWKDFVPKMHPPYTGKLLSFESSVPSAPSQIRPGYLDPLGKYPKRTGKYDLDLWIYRRLIDKSNFVEGTYASDITLVNWPQNDYAFGRFVDVSPEEYARQIDRAKQLSLSLLYWLQTAAPRMDGGTGFPGLRLRNDLVGTADGLAKFPYIRESRRIRAEFTVLEQHVGAEMRKSLPFPQNTKGEKFFDSVGVGYYHIDLHPATGGDNYIDIGSLPFEIPLGALIPRRVENLMPVSKNIGSTHVTNGCYRLHHVEWGIGEAGGMLTAFCRGRKVSPRPGAQGSNAAHRTANVPAGPGSGTLLAWIVSAAISSLRFAASVTSSAGLQIEQAQPRDVGLFQEIAIEVLALQHGQLVRGHLAAVGAELVVERLARRQRFFLGLAAAQGGDEFLLHDSEALLQVFEIVERSGEQVIERGGGFFASLLCGGPRRCIEISLHLAGFEGRGFALLGTRLVRAGHTLRFGEDRLGAEGDRVHHLGLLGLGAPLLEGDVDAAQDGFERHSRVLPAFEQSPVQRGQQEEAGAAGALEMLLDLGVVVEVVVGEVGFAHAGRTPPARMVSTLPSGFRTRRKP